MKAFAVLGLAGNIVQFLDFSGKLIAGAFEIHQALDGATSSNNALEKIYGDLEDLCCQLQTKANTCAKISMTNSEGGLLTLVKSCQVTGQELLAILEDLKVQGRHKKWESIRQAFRGSTKTPQIQ